MKTVFENDQHTAYCESLAGSRFQLFIAGFRYLDLERALQTPSDLLRYSFPPYLLLLLRTYDRFDAVAFPRPCVSFPFHVAA